MRSEWIRIFRQIVMPVLDGFQSKTFKDTFVQQIPSDYTRPPCTAHVEAFCRTVMSVAPLFQLMTEDALDIEDIRQAYIASWKVVIDERYIDWNCGDQLMVEAANLVYAFLLYPNSWHVLPASCRHGILDVLRRASAIKPYNNNWLLFKCIIDIFLHTHKRIVNLTHIYKLLDTVESWYIGDSWYKDGPGFHMDYYNSFVILPFLYVIYGELKKDVCRTLFQTRFQTIVSRIARHAEFLERLIAPDGTFPLFGRSIVYRSAIFHTLVLYMTHIYSPGLPALAELPESTLSYGQVRRALERVHTRLFGPEQFDAAGYFHLGFLGAQPGVANHYSNNGSCYFTGLSFSVLGLPDSHPFWTADTQPYTQEIAWGCIGSPCLKKDASRT
jgi:hypothetical protein